MSHQKHTSAPLNRLTRANNKKALNFWVSDVPINDADLTPLAALVKASDCKFRIALTAGKGGGAANDITNAGLAKLAGRTMLQVLSLHTPHDINEGLGHFKESNLNHLTLSGSSIDDVGLKHISGIKNLAALNLQDVSAITDEGFAQLGKMLKLESLVLQNAYGLTDKGLEAFCSLNMEHRREDDKAPALIELTLSGAGIGDRGLQDISTMKKLEVLEIKNASNITDMGLAQLAALPKLKSLVLRNTAGLTDQGLETFSKGQFERISIEGDNYFTEEALARIKKPEVESAPAQPPKVRGR